MTDAFISIPYVTENCPTMFCDHKRYKKYYMYRKKYTLLTLVRVYDLVFPTFDTSE